MSETARRILQNLKPRASADGTNKLSGDYQGDQERFPANCTGAELLAMELPEPKCLIPGILPEVGLTILAGRPKSGKSWLSLSIVTAMATPGAVLNAYFEKPHRVMLLALEDNRRRMKARLKKTLGNAKTGPTLLHIFNDWPRLEKTGIDLMNRWLDEHRDTRLIVADTFTKIKARRMVSESSYEADYEALSVFKKIADERELAALAIMHTRKADAEDIFDSVSGTLGITGTADAVLVLKRTRGQADAELHVTGRDVEEKVFALNFDAALGRWSMLGDADDFQGTKKQTDVLKLLRSSSRPMKPGDVAKHFGWERRATGMRLLRMQKAGTIRNDGAGGYFVAIDHAPR